MESLDYSMMRRALTLARRGEGRVEPNPMVGCVIVRDGKIIGEGFHRRFGGPHAEVEALRACKRAPRGATAYVTLEPCCHFGKTPPCTDALIDAGVREVVIPFFDPNPLVRGGGVRALKKAGIRVRTGVLVAEAAEILAPFLTRVRLNRPYVIAKWAQSLNGKLATPPGGSRWISGPASLRRVHQLRARVDAVLVGVETVLSDDPLLNARGVPLRRLATRVVLDSRLRTSLHSRLVATAKAIPTLLFTTDKSTRSRKAAELRRRGVTLVACPTRAGHLNLPSILRKLFDLGVTNLVVEGGPTVHSSFLGEGLVDEAMVFVAPRWIGSDGGAIAPGIGRGVRSVGARRCGDDLMYALRFSDSAALVSTR